MATLPGRPLRLAMAITALGCGGAERVFSRLASFLAMQGHHVRVLVLHGGEVFFPLPSTIELQRCPVAEGAASGRFYRRQMWLRRQLREFDPDLILSFIEVANVHALLAAPPRVPVIVSERTDPRWHRPPAVYRALRGLVYGRAACVLVQSEGLRPWAERRGKHHAVAVMPNPVFPAPAAPPSDRTPRVVSFGRLSPEKGYGDLLQAFAGVAPAFPEWQVVIFGEGPERLRLLGLVERLHLQGRVLLPGAVADPAAQLRRGDVFALTSRYEGFPNALAEAMARGAAVVAYDCPSGPRELIRPGVDGVLIPSGDLQALAEALTRLMGSEQERLRLGERAREISQRFPADEILARWEALCQRVAIGATDRPPAG